MSKFNINLHEAVYSLSDALDLVGVTHIHHGKRVAYIATECGKKLGWQEQHMDDLFEAAILHDCGVSKTAVHAQIARFESEQGMEHCQIGADLLSSCLMLSHLSDFILYHHTHWSELKDLDIPMQVKLTANCIYLTDRVDVLTLECLDNGFNVELSIKIITDKVLEKSGDWFCPELVDVLLSVIKSPMFWTGLENGYTGDYSATWKNQTPNKEIEFTALKSLVHVFSHIVDAKSPFTKEHSDGVASLAKFLGAGLGLSEESCEMLELAGLLHDLGKLRVPDELLEKPDKLTPEEYEIMQRHSYDTYDILKNINGLEKVTEWASQHHEHINGSGYPFHASQNQISLESRIVAVADVFQALAQNRPYRQPLEANAILAILQKMVDKGHLDGDIVAFVESHLDDCFNAAHCR